jgi:hypothetical protein
MYGLTHKPVGINTTWGTRLIRHAFKIILLVGATVSGCSNAGGQKPTPPKLIGKPNTKPPQGPGSGSSPKEKPRPAESLSLFQPSVYTLTKEWCGGAACHASAQAPIISHEDPAKALDSILSTAKVDFNSLERSRLYLRLASDQHHCPSGMSCQDAGGKMLDALKTWAAGLKLEGGIQDLKKTPEVGVRDASTVSVPEGSSARSSKELTFDVADLVGIPGAKITLLIELDYSRTNTYLLSRPHLDLPISNGKSVKIKGLRILRNDTYMAESTTFHGLDVTLDGLGGDLSTVGTTVDYDKGPDEDRFSLAFDVIKVLD